MGEALDRLNKLDGRLRCVANGKADVNAVRARQNGAVRMKRQSRETDIVTMPPPESGLKSMGKSLRSIRRGTRQTELSDDVEVNVFVLFSRLDAPTPPSVSRRNGRVGVATVTLAELETLNANPDIQAIELGETLKAPDPVIKAEVPVAPPAGRLKELSSGARKVGLGTTIPLDHVGENVLVGIIDVGGIDFAHPDFLDDDGASRVIAIWDQGGEAFDPPDLAVSESKAGKSTGYGSEIRAEDISSAMAQAAGAKLSPYDLAPQSQQELGSHATHVASIAAGRTGVAKRAKIAAVMIALAKTDIARGRSFYDTTRIVDGLAYLFDLEQRGGFAGVSINISLGTNGGAHDGSEFISRWIDTSMFEPGRTICVAAGNAGQDSPQYEGDRGFWSGRIHASGRIPAASLRRDLEWIVVGNGFEDISENGLDIWYGAEDEFSVELFAPGGQRIGPVAPGNGSRTRCSPTGPWCRSITA